MIFPLEFFIRVIWQESRFQSKAVGPVTRNGQRAVGIARNSCRGRRANVGCSIPSIRCASAAEVGRIFERTAPSIRQSRARRSRLQCRTATGAGMACGLGRDAAGDPQLRCSHHRNQRRRLGARQQEREDARSQTEHQLPRLTGVA